MNEIKKLCEKIIGYRKTDNHQTLDYIVNYLQLPIDDLAKYSDKEMAVLNLRNTIILKEMENIRII